MSSGLLDARKASASQQLAAGGNNAGDGFRVGKSCFLSIRTFCEAICPYPLKMHWQFPGVTVWLASPLPSTSCSDVRVARAYRNSLTLDHMDSIGLKSGE